jgi:hypothetical protein
LHKNICQRERFGVKRTWFNDRTFQAEIKKGKPKLWIKEIKEQMECPLDKQLPKYRRIVSRINFYVKCH